MECWICLQPLEESCSCPQQLCSHRFHAACLAEVQEASGSSRCPCQNSDAGSESLCRRAAVEYLRVLRATSVESPARFVVSQRCLGYLQKALALDASHSRSLVLLGVLHQAGIGVERDHFKACQLFEQSHASGDALGTLHLARCFKKGLGCGQDTYKARALFGEADVAGNVMATLELAIMCRSGLGGEKDLEKALGLFQKAHEAGDALGAYELGKAYLAGGFGGRVAPDPCRARALLEAAHARGYALATAELGRMYMSGLGGPEDEQTGRELLLSLDFPKPQAAIAAKALREGWMAEALAELYQADMDRLDKDKWWQLREPEEDPYAMLKAAGLYVQKAPKTKAVKVVVPPPGHAEGGVWRAAMAFDGMKYGDPVEVTADQSRGAKGSRVVCSLKDDVSIIAEYVLPKDLDAFLRKQPDGDDKAVQSCTPFGSFSSRLRFWTRRS